MSTNDDLPPLPRGDRVGSYNGVDFYMHSDDSMQAYAREAIAADRSKRAAPEGWQQVAHLF